MENSLMKLTRIIFILFLFINCTNNDSDKKSGISSDTLIPGNNPEPSGKSTFQNFLRNFRYAELPIVIKVDQDTTLIDRLKHLEVKDFPFIKDEGYSDIHAYCILPDTSNYYSLVWFVPADNLAPLITTFSKNGDMISQELIGAGRCGSDCCYSCFETVTINRDHSIHAVDTISSCDCDEKGNPREDTRRNYIYLRTGSINKNGKIVMTEGKEENIKVHK
jgi:hypothetical protein